MPDAGPDPSGDFLGDFLDDFFAECDEHLTDAHRDLLAVESRIGHSHIERKLLDSLFRSFHSLKGLCGMAGLQPGEELAHALESYLRGLRQDQVVLSAAGFEALLGGTRTLGQAVASLRDKQPLPPTRAALSALASVTAEPAAPSRAPAEQAAAPGGSPLAGEDRARLEAARAEGKRAWRVRFAPTHELAARGIGVNSVRERLQSLGEVLHAAPHVTGPQGISFEFLVLTDAEEAALAAWRDEGLTYEPYSEPLPPAAAPEREAGGAAVAPSHLVRVDLGRLDALMGMVGEMVITRARLDRQLAGMRASMPLARWRALQDVSLMFERQLRELRENVMRVRLVPIGDVFVRMQFVVRDLAHESGKQVRLELHGQDTEIDKYVVERMMDALLHIVRNAVSHGIESAEERVAQGKPPAGRLELRAATEGDTVIIQVGDDGRGVDAQRVAEHAREMGMPVPPGPLDSAALLDVLCAPGFSTREQADRASGRGVGMATVQQVVRELGGSLALETQPGRGTLFTVRLPITLAIVDALIVSAGGQTFAAPLPAIREVIEVPAADIAVIEGREIMRHLEGALPLLRLSRILQLPESDGHAYYALVVGQGSAAAGIVVDRLVGQREVVVRALSDELVQVPGLSGATELGDGRPVLILDLSALLSARPAVRAAGGL